MIDAIVKNTLFFFTFSFSTPFFWKSNQIIFNVIFLLATKANLSISVVNNVIYMIIEVHTLSYIRFYLFLRFKKVMEIVGKQTAQAH